MLRKNREYSDKIEQMCRNWGSIFDFEVKYSEKKQTSILRLTNIPKKIRFIRLLLNPANIKLC